MFSLPQPVQSTESNDDNVVPIAENAETMRQILSLTYPCDAGFSLKDAPMSKLIHLLRISNKYNLELATSRVIEVLTTRTSVKPSEAMTIYAVACALEYNDLASLASTATLKCGASELLLVPAKPNVGEMSSVDPTGEETDSQQEIFKSFWALDYLRLLNFHRQRYIDAKRIIESLSLTRTYGCPYQGTSTCASNFENTFKFRAVQEIDWKGANSGVLDTQFCASCMWESSCADCYRSLLTGSMKAELDKIRAKIDSLPSSITTADHS